MLTVALCLPGLASSAWAKTYHVDSRHGSDTSDGLSPGAGRALATIQEAARRAAPGDEILVAKGVYFGPIDLRIAGKPGQPITLRAASREKNAVVITNAARALREGRVPWTLVDQTLGLYSAPLERPTCRVLYSGVDLQPYKSLEALKTFTSADGNPGPRHGYFYDEREGKLYVRLHASGKYGSANPADHVMSVGPRTGAGFAGNQYDGPLFYNLSLAGGGDLHVVIDGFTFETPGYTGVLVDGNDVTVRDCWFQGCRGGVSGRCDPVDETQSSNRIVVEHCDYHHYPAFDDAIELMEVRRAENPIASPPKFPAFWWSRKGGGTGDALTYETGICNNVGTDWVVRYNDIHDAFEALSSWTVSWSRRLDVNGNRMARLVDNAVEAENHASGMRIHGNLIVNVIEPFSWQPLGGEPWPGPVYIYDNVVISEDWLNQLITGVMNWTPGWFKAGASSQNWDAPWIKNMQGVPRDRVRAPGDGVVVFNNTVYFPGGDFFTRVHPADRKFENFFFANNISIAAGFSMVPGNAEDFRFSHNVWYNAPEGEGRGQIFAGEDGQVFQGLPPGLEPGGKAAKLLGFLTAGEPWKTVAGTGVPQAEAAYRGADRIVAVGAGFGTGRWEIPGTGPRP